MSELRVLIVDDEDYFREIILKKLIDKNIDAEGAENGTKALEMLKKQDFDVVVLDINMPGIDGIETLRQIKISKPEVEVIMLTGYVSVEFGIKGMQLGAFDYVMKPVPMHELMDKISQAYDKKMENGP
ncbi:MAG: response regulator [Desulfamplus sp.]|nr:response regulator [Desulfamplus sp.]